MSIDRGLGHKSSHQKGLAEIHVFEQGWSSALLAGESPNWGNCVAGVPEI
jgi:hypothetical protein